jgi:hypothetical protein
MLCEMCASIGRMRLSEAQQRSGGSSVEGFSLECDACGGTLGASVGDRVARTIARLARFGLVGQNRLFRRTT